MSRYDSDLIDSARAAGQHVSRQAWFAADGSNVEAKRKSAQTILAGLESMLRDCSNGPEMLARLSVQVGRLTGSSFPPEAQPFFDSVAENDPDKLPLEDARNLLLAYMRLRRPSSKTGVAAAEEEASEDEEPQSYEDAGLSQVEEL